MIRTTRGCGGADARVFDVRKQVGPVAAHVVEWLTEPAKRAVRAEQLAELKERVGHGGASQRAASYMLETLASREKRRLRTHHSFATGGEPVLREAA
jgi:hypothetical protein